MIMEVVRIKFSADIYIDGKTMEEIREKFESLPLWSDQAKVCSAECSEILLVEDAETYEDKRHEYDHAYDKHDQSEVWINPEEQKIWSVWVGDVEVNDFLLTREEAEDLAQEYIDDGYDDVVIDKYENK
jgi:hypothetical protein